MPPPSVPKIRYNLEVGQFQCPVCPFIANCGEVRMHAFADHSIPLTFPITCPFCPLTFQTDRAVTNHACQMKGKCALTEPAAQNSLQDNSAEQARDLIADLRLTTRSGTSTGGANAAGRGTIPRRASKGTGIGSTGDKTKTGRISKSGSGQPSPPVEEAADR